MQHWEIAKANNDKNKLKNWRNAQEFIFNKNKNEKKEINNAGRSGWNESLTGAFRTCWIFLDFLRIYQAILKLAVSY